MEEIHEEFSNLLKEIEYPGDVSSNKLAWAVKLRNAKSILRFLCDNFSKDNVLMKEELAAFKDLEQKGVLCLFCDVFFKKK